MVGWEDFSRVIFGPNGRPGLFKGDFSSMSIYKVQRKGIVRILVRKQTKAFANYLGLFMGAGGRTHYFTISAH